MNNMNDLKIKAFDTLQQISALEQRKQINEAEKDIVQKIKNEKA